MAASDSHDWKTKSRGSGTLNANKDELLTLIQFRVIEGKEVYRCRFRKKTSDGRIDILETSDIVDLLDAKAMVEDRKKSFGKSGSEYPEAAPRTVYSIKWAKGKRYFGKVEEDWYNIPSELVNLMADLKKQDCHETMYDKDTDDEDQVWRYMIGVSGSVRFVERDSKLYRIPCKSNMTRSERKLAIPKGNTIASQDMLFEDLPELEPYMDRLLEEKEEEKARLLEEKEEDEARRLEEEEEEKARLLEEEEARLRVKEQEEERRIAKKPVWRRTPRQTEYSNTRGKDKANSNTSVSRREPLQPKHSNTIKGKAKNDSDKSVLRRKTRQTEDAADAENFDDAGHSDDK